MQKKIFVLTGEPSGDKLAAKAVSKLKKINNNIEYLSVGGTYLKSKGIKSIFKLEEITYLGFTRVILNLFKIKRKINYTVKKILEFNPDILFSVDSPDFTLRVAKIVKKKNSNIKTIHYVAPQVWLWREGRVKKIKNFIDHILLLFNFEKKYFDKENINSTFVGHPLLDNEIKNMFKNSGFTIVKEKKIQLAKSEAEQFYKVHEIKPFYNDLCAYLSSGPIVVMILEKDNAVLDNRQLMGATNPKDAEDETIRKKFGISIDKNSVHGSDSVENGKIEIDFFFKD